MEWTLEWMLPTPMPLHTFIQPPIVVEVRDRHPDADKLVYKGPNVAGGYPHPLTGELVSEVRAQTRVCLLFPPPLPCSPSARARLSPAPPRRTTSA